MDMYAKCVECQRELIPHRLWRAVDSGDRRQWRREDKACAAADGLCTGCYARADRIPETSPLTPNPCIDCGISMVRTRVWRKADAEQQESWKVKGLGKSAGVRCEPCYTLFRAAGGSSEPVGESPFELQDGRWVTGRGPNGFPVQV